MKLELKRFQQEYFAEYAAWFVDHELNRHLGPIDQEWLDAVLSQPESAGATWAVFRHRELVAVVETVYDPENRLPAAITAIAVKPELRRQGICTNVLRSIVALHKPQGITEHVAYISVHNPGGQRCAIKAGFVPVKAEPDERGYLEFRHLQQKGKEELYS
ncbi:MAG TPA: GNAT family N-acetyltransferase [Candidatus Saccharimonadales bacterium]|nr:GNAT family N-acetyltransferase [Candidatus Saccharimonadales bacterium]